MYRDTHSKSYSCEDVLGQLIREICCTNLHIPGFSGSKQVSVVLLLCNYLLYIPILCNYLLYIPILCNYLLYIPILCNYLLYIPILCNYLLYIPILCNYLLYIPILCNYLLYIPILCNYLLYIPTPASLLVCLTMMIIMKDDIFMHTRVQADLRWGNACALYPGHMVEK